jgi:hypothetical protein
MPHERACASVGVDNRPPGCQPTDHATRRVGGPDHGGTAVPLLDLFFSMLWFFLFVVWIWLLISVYADIFRSDDLSGVRKALWVVFVLLLPYLGVLVYLIARGDSMHQRTADRTAAAEQAMASYIRDVAAPTSAADEIAKLAQLRDQGALSEDEFAQQKAKLLAST